MTVRDHHAEAGPAAGFARAHTPPRYPPDLQLEPTHLALEARVDLDARTVNGTVTHTLVARNGRATEATFDAVDLVIHEVSDPSAAAIAWRYDGTRVHVRWTSAVGRGETRSLVIRFTATDPITGFLFGRSGPDRWETASWAGTDHETQRARYWLPCVDHPAVRTTLALDIRARTGLTVLASGALQASEAHDDDTSTHRWVLDQPCPAYLLCVVVGELVCADLGEAQGVPVQLFAPAPHTAEDLTRNLGDTGALLDWITTRLDRPYPYPKYFQWAGPGVGGAMENISLVSWDSAWVLDPDHHRERGWLSRLINLHEMAHTWFGDAVVIRDFAHGWLKESWATYMESVFVEAEEGAEAMAWQLHTEATAYMGEADDRYVRPILTRHYESGWDMFDHHLYPGGAWRLHMLRRMLGDDTFWPAVTDYLATYEGEVVETDDFRRTLEAHSGRNLEQFFTQWIGSPGYPKLSVRSRHRASKGQLELTIEQKQLDKKKQVGTFRFDLTVAVVDAEGAWTRHSLDIQRARQVFVLPVSAAPKMVILDPDQDALFSLDYDPGQDQLVAMLGCDASLKARLHAARTLAKSGRRTALDAVAARLAVEPFWGARVGIIQALAKAGSRAAGQILVEHLLVETDPRVPGWLTRAVGAIQEAVVANGLRRWLDRGESLPWARAGALHALGRQRDDLDVPRLVAALEGGDAWGWQRLGALAGLGAHRSEAACAHLFDQLDTGLPHQRAGAAMALAECATWCPRQVQDRAVDALGRLTRDPDTRIRTRAGHALGRLRRPAGAAAVRALVPRVAGQDGPSLDRVAARLEKAGPPRPAKADLDKLSAQVRALQDRLDRLEAGSSVEGDRRED